MAKAIKVKELESAFHMKPEEIVDFFKSKGLKTSFNWHEVYEEAHGKAFTVAKMTELDLLSDTKKLLERAIENGESFSTFKKDAKKLFNEKGWTGYKELKDPKTGETIKAELGTPRRIKQIYDCNMNSAYAVGRYREMLEEIDVAPIWVFKTMADGRERPEHAALHDKAYRADDAFWVVFFPPLGWGCRCYVINLTKYQAKELGIDVESTEGKIKPTTVLVGDKEMPTQSYTFEKAGKIITLTPDAGWGTNLGVQAWGIDVQAWSKVEGLPEQIKYNFIAKMAENPYKKEAFIKWAENIFENGFKNTKLEKTLTWISPELFKKIDNVPNSPIVVIQNNQIGHSGMNKNAKQMLTKEEYLRVYDIVNKPDEIYWDYTNSKWEQIAFVRRISNSDECIKVCVRFNQKSRSRDKNQMVSKVTTVGKIKYHNIANGKNYKKIE